MRQCRRGDADVTVDVDVEGTHPLLLGQVLGGLQCPLRRHVVHQDVQATERLDGALHHGPALLGRGEVTGDEFAVTALRADEFRGVLGVLVLIEVGIVTSAPSLANAMATALPIPESPPVTSARLPDSSSRPG